MGHLVISVTEFDPSCRKGLNNNVLRLEKSLKVDAYAIHTLSHTLSQPYIIIIIFIYMMRG